MTNLPSPTLQAILVADHVYQDKSTNKWIVCGIFDRLYVKPTPDEEETSQVGQLVTRTAAELMAAGSPFAYIRLTSCRGTQDFELRYVELDQNSVIFTTRFKVACEDPNAFVQLGMPLPMLPSKLGEYVLELLCENVLIGGYRISCMGPNREGKE